MIRLIYKQLFGQLLKDKVFLSLLMLLTILTSFSFFFVMFSVDGNLSALNPVEILSENQQNYLNALNSNTTLARIFLMSMTGLTSLVFVMFFYRFFAANKRQIGCIKALGVRNKKLQLFFVMFTVILSVIGTTVGLLGGYFASSILINANSHTHSVTGLIKGVSLYNLAFGVFIPTAVFGIVSMLCFGFVEKKEAGFLLSGNDMRTCFPVTLKIADKISRIAPYGMRFSLRIALRKPLSILLLITAIMSFNVCVILGQSLNISSETVFKQQTDGHNYEFDVRLSEFQTEQISDNTMSYITEKAVILTNGYELNRVVTGFYDINELYSLKNESGELLTMPKIGRVYINPELSEIYGVKIGEQLELLIGEKQISFIVDDIAINAQARSVYINIQQLTEILGISRGAYNGALSSTALLGGTTISSTERVDELNRNAVSNKVSAVINQAAGVLVGAVLIFLALYLNFRDNTHDILILNMIGQRNKYIRKMLVDVYFPVMCVAFVVTVFPSIVLAMSIQKSLSVSTDDYMPFGCNLLVIAVAFAAICLIYRGVTTVFNFGIKRVIVKGEIVDVVYAE